MISLSRCVILLYLAPLSQWWVSRWGKSSGPSSTRNSCLLYLGMFFLGGSPLVCYRGNFLSLCFCGWSLWFFVLSLLRLLCVWSPRGRAGLPLPPFVGWFASLSGPVVWFGALLRLSSPLAPPPWRLVVLISGSEGFPSVVSVWISGCFGNGLGVWPVCLTSCLLLTGLEMEICLLPCVFVLYGTKGFGPVWGTALYTMLCLASCGLWLPPLSRLHVAPRHRSLRRSACVRPPPRRTLLISLSVPLCLSWALLLCRFCFLFVSSSGAVSVVFLCCSPSCCPVCPETLLRSS